MVSLHKSARRGPGADRARRARRLGVDRPVGIGNFHIHSWSNTTNRRWCLESTNGTCYAHPGYEPAVDYGNAVFRSAYEC